MKIIDFLSEKVSWHLKVLKDFPSQDTLHMVGKKRYHCAYICMKGEILLRNNCNDI